MAGVVPGGWRRRLGLNGGLGPLAGGIFVFGLGEALWSRYLPEYLRFLGASALLGVAGTVWAAVTLPSRSGLSKQEAS